VTGPEGLIPGAGRSTGIPVQPPVRSGHPSR
jgi:hypothetical protein